MHWSGNTVRPRSPILHRPVNFDSEHTDSIPTQLKRACSVCVAHPERTYMTIYIDRMDRCGNVRSMISITLYSLSHDRAVVVQHKLLTGFNLATRPKRALSLSLSLLSTTSVCWCWYTAMVMACHLIHWVMCSTREIRSGTHIDANLASSGPRLRLKRTMTMSRQVRLVYGVR